MCVFWPCTAPFQWWMHGVHLATSRAFSKLQGMRNWILFEDAHVQESIAAVKKSPQAFKCESFWSTRWHIVSANTSLSCCLHYCNKASSTLSLNMNVEPLRAFLNGLQMWKSHGVTSRLYAWCLTTSYHTESSWSQILCVMWEQVTLHRTTTLSSSLATSVLDPRMEFLRHLVVNLNWLCHYLFQVQEHEWCHSCPFGYIHHPAPHLWAAMQCYLY